MADVPTYREGMTNNPNARPFNVTLNGVGHDRGVVISRYFKTHTFKSQRRAYGVALDFVVHGPKTNRAIIRFNGKPFLHIEKIGGWKVLVTIDSHIGSEVPA